MHQGIEDALNGETNLDVKMEDKDKKILLDQAHSTIILSLGDKVFQQVSKENTVVGIWSKLEDLYMTKSLVNRLKQALFI